VTSDSREAGLSEGSTAPELLEGCRVVDFSTGLAGPYCTRLLAAAGAEVLKVEHGDGDPMRRWSPTGSVPAGEDSAMFQFLNEGKKGVQGHPDDPSIDGLISLADIVVESFVPAALDVASLRHRFPGLVVLSVTAFGRTGPWADRVASDFTADAEGGVLAVRGLPGGTPVRIGVRITEYIAGAYGAAAALAALRRARASGMGEHIDLSIAETANVSGTNLMPMRHEIQGRPPITEPARWVEVPGVEPTADGWVGITLMSRQQFDDFLVMIDRPDLVGNDDWAKLQYRFEHMDEWNKIVREWTCLHTTAEVLELASLLRIPWAPINDGRTAAEFEPFVARAAVGPCGDGSFVAPRPPIRIGGRRLALQGPAPSLGAPGTRVADRTVSARPVSANGAPGRPLRGLRVLDVTIWYAGPVVGQLFAALGAEVIHLESHVRLEGGRTTTGGYTGERWWEHGFLFHHANVGKRSLAVDLNREEGRAAVKRVIAGCDLVVENYSPRVFDNFGLGWEEIHRLNPQVSLVRLPAFGLDGPWRDRIGFGETMEQSTGLAWVTGFPDEPPLGPAGPCDPLTGGHGAVGALLGLDHRDRTGEGVLVEVAMAEAVLSCAAEPIVDYSAYGRLLQRDGNRSRLSAPQGLYRCRGFEQWLALTVAGDEQWMSLKEVMGRPSWADNQEYDHLAGRQAGHDAIDGHLAAWAAEQDLPRVVEALIARGVAAGAVADPRLGRLHPQFAARGLYEETDHPLAGRLAVGTIPFRFASIDRWWTAPAPTLGQHNADVLRDVAGLDGQTIRRLERDGVIGQVPVGIGSDAVVN
jgi:crotonobetainyl-CoA:carnitine CoA-transferase CaiB-like acyl-CoA transferase